MNDDAVLILNPSDLDCFGTYIANQKSSLNKFLPAGLVSEQSGLFVERLGNLTSQLDEFMESDAVKKSWLVLGKVQSGKTSHLLGTLAYASTRKFALATVFTGVNDALNLQFMERATSDVSSSCIQIFSVPTSSSSAAYRKLHQDVSSLIETRMLAQAGSLNFTPALPVLITMKNKARVTTLGKLLDDLNDTFGGNLSFLMIDDEADQASQNTKAQSKQELKEVKEVAATYGAIANLRQKDIRHCMLAYTATPQAVLLAEKTGALRPDRCVTIPPRLGYFGLTEIVSSDYARNLVDVPDIETGKAGSPSNWRSIPLSLKNALTDFYLTGLIQKQWPEVFYSDSQLAVDQMQSPPKSTQMLIHQSVAKKEHTAIYGWVDGFLKEFKESLLEHIRTNTMMPELVTSWDAKRTRTGLATLPENLELSHLSKILENLLDTGVKIVNSDKSNPTVDVVLPVSSAQWNSKKAWIFIGGEILGRGLTIPQLTTTYFIRTAKKSNFDTVSQQMRFCGYRSDYWRMTSIWAPADTVEKFGYMSKIDDVVWRYAIRWDKNRTPLTGKIPPILYAAPLAAKLEPTRKNVQDPDIKDLRFGKDKTILVSPTQIFNPHHFFSNLHSLRSWMADKGSLISTQAEWTKVNSVSPTEFKKLVAPWDGSSQRVTELRSIAELFSEDIGELGLAEQPITMFVRSNLLTPEILANPLILLEPGNYIERAVKPSQSGYHWGSWQKLYAPGNNGHVWPELSTPHVGEGQRSLVNGLPFDGTVLIIEPIVAHPRGETSNKVGLGLAFTIFKPADYEVRIMG
jgi:hypothetical protein